MKRMLCVAMVLVLSLSLCPTGVWAFEDRDIVSAAAVLMDADTGEILYSKNPHSRYYPASITKVLTGLLVVERTSPSDVLTVSSEATRLPPGYSNIALRAGEQLSVDDAMYALMLKSANDVANALGEHVGGSTSNFAAMMNQRAWQAGANNSNFVNASGVPHSNHYTTAYDMAMITRAATQNAQFMRYYTALRHTMAPTNVRSSTLAVSNHHLMMFEDDQFYNPDVIGGKIGYTDASQHTMTTVATRGGRTLICVVLYSSQRGKYTDTQTLLDWGFNQSMDVNLFSFLNQ